MSHARNCQGRSYSGIHSGIGKDLTTEYYSLSNQSNENIFLVIDMKSKKIKFILTSKNVRL